MLLLNDDFFVATVILFYKVYPMLLLNELSTVYIIDTTSVRDNELYLKAL